MIPRYVRVAQVLWPAFVMAAALETVVFALLDPSQVHLGTWAPSGMTVYSLGFLLFWLMASMSGAVTWMMLRTQHEDRHGDEPALDASPSGELG